MITHPEKLLFPGDGITKADVAGYYHDVARVLLPHLRRRPITMERFPAGIDEAGFIQKDVVKGFPAWLTRIEAPRKEGGMVHYASAGSVRALAWLANQNTIALHVWLSRAPRLDRPDLCVIDLDPSQQDADALRTTVLAVRDAFTELGHESWVKTSGSKGFHVAARLGPRATFDTSSDLALRVARTVESKLPALVTLEFRKADRGGRILIDVARNRAGATVVAPYSLRAKPGAPVSAPCTWDEVETAAVEPQTFTLRHMAERIARVGDLWSPLAPRSRKKT